MPAKKTVRFAYANTYHRPSLPMPGLTYSASTLQSSPALSTPPTLARPLPHTARYPQSYPHMPFSKAPSSRYHRVLLHRYLTPSAINWNLLDHFSMGTRGHHRLSHNAVHEPASEPPLPFIQIFIHPFWSCEVHASNRRYVTVADVLECLYKSLRANITQHEFQTLSEKDRMVATQAYQKRYRRHRGGDLHLYEREKTRGMKRVDFLMGRIRFGGLSERHNPHEFDLQVT